MKRKAPWRVRVLGWGNLALGVATPLGIWFNILAALRVFSVDWAGGSIVIATLLGAVIGCLTGRSGWGILHARPWAFKATCMAGGLTLGYTCMGIMILVSSDYGRGLEILIRHGSEDWWDWSLSHFQNSAVREIPMLAWWILGFGTMIRFRHPGWPGSARERFAHGFPLVFCFLLIGAISRTFQLAQDHLLSSQR